MLYPAILGLVLTSVTLSAALDGNPSGSTTVTKYYVYNSPSNGTEQLDWGELEWTEVASLSSQIEPRICDGCSHCQRQSKQSAEVLQTGKWWTPWCQVKGLTTRQSGDSLSLGQSKITSTTVSTEFQITAPMSESLTATLGWSVTKSKGVEVSIGCVNEDGVAHGLWLQEYMGWAEEKVTTEYYNVGDCDRDPPAPTSKIVKMWYPDPENNGFRKFQTQCKWAAEETGPFCDVTGDESIFGPL